MNEYTPTTEEVENAYSLREDNAEFGNAEMAREWFAQGGGKAAFNRWLTALKADVRKAALLEAARIAENTRPEIGAHINVTEYRQGKYDALLVAASRIRAAALGDAPTGGQ